MFKYDLDSISGGQPVGLDEESGDYKELDSEEPVTIRDLDSKPKFKPPTLEDSMIRPGKYQEDDSLVLDENQFDEARYESVNEIDGSEDDSVKYLEPDNVTLSDIEKDIINPNIPFLNLEESIYKTHDTNIENDQNKKK